MSRLAVAVIGCGGRGEASLAAAAEETLVAIADVDDARLAAAATKVSRPGVRPKPFFDYRRMFDALHKDIDAVFIATPDHHHAPASMAAMQLGKHVFCEKPLCHDIHQARTLAAAARRYKVITQMGNQGHCGEGYRRLCEYLWAGAIGEVVETHSWNGFVNGGAGGRPPARPVPPGLHWDEWLGPAPYRDYHPGLHPAYWRYYWDFGTGALGDWGCHNLDGVFWGLQPGYPASVECLHKTGGSEEKYPQGSIIRWEVPARGKMPALKVHWYDGMRTNTDPNVKDEQGKMAAMVPNPPPLAAELEKKYNRQFDRSFNGGGTFYVGTKGIMATGNYGNGPADRAGGGAAGIPASPAEHPADQGNSFRPFHPMLQGGKAYRGRLPVRGGHHRVLAPGASGHPRGRGQQGALGRAQHAVYEPSRLEPLGQSPMPQRLGGVSTRFIPQPGMASLSDCRDASHLFGWATILLPDFSRG